MPFRVSPKTIDTLIPYQRKFGYDQKYEWDKIALKHMKNCNRILDIGCGEGRFISHDPKKILGIDKNKQSVNVCKRKGFNAQLGNAGQLSFKNATFDAVHCSHVIEHLFPEEAYKLLYEMNRVLKKNGILCIRTPLINKEFYNDFTHVKPYYPKAILHYLKTCEPHGQRSLAEIDDLYTLLKLKYRRKQILSEINDTPLWFLGIIFNILYKFGIRSFKKTGYMLILQKS